MGAFRVYRFIQLYPEGMCTFLRYIILQRSTKNCEKTQFSVVS